MKKTRNICLVALLAIGFVSCTNNKSEKTSTIVLKEYVDSMNNANIDYTIENWATIDKGYQERVALAEAEKEKLSDEDKAELENVKKKYAELKVKYDANLIKATEVNDPKVRLRNSLFGEGKVGQDMAFAFVNAENARSIYQSFVDAVDANKKEYSREDWDEIKVLYEALDNRKNEIEKELATKDNLNIATLKVKFATIYDLNRPASKVRENEDAKK